MREQTARTLHFVVWCAAWVSIGAMLFCAISCTALKGAYTGFVQGWQADPPPPSIPGIPFYANPSFWTWALGGAAGVATAAHTLVGKLPGVPAVPGTPVHRRRKQKSEAPKA